MVEKEERREEGRKGGQEGRGKKGRKGRRKNDAHTFYVLSKIKFHFYHVLPMGQTDTDGYTISTDHI